MSATVIVPRPPPRPVRLPPPPPPEKPGPEPKLYEGEALRNQCVVPRPRTLPIGILAGCWGAR